MASSCEFFRQSWYLGPSCQISFPGPLLARAGLKVYRVIHQSKQPNGDQAEQPKSFKASFCCSALASSAGTVSVGCSALGTQAARFIIEPFLRQEQRKSQLLSQNESKQRRYFLLTPIYTEISCLFQGNNSGRQKSTAL